MFDYQPTVLIIEDDDYIRRFVRQALESEGCTVHEADTVKRGLIEAGTRQPDAIVLDLGLPDEDGMTLIRELRGWTEVPVLVLSARSAEADKVAALDAGADDYLTKPFGVSELLARLRVLRRHARRRGQRVGDQLRRRARGFRQARGRAQRPACAPDGDGVSPAGRLLAHRGKVMTHRELLREVWGPRMWRATTTCASIWGTCARSWKPIPPSPCTCSPRSASATASPADPRRTRH